MADERKYPDIYYKSLEAAMSDGEVAQYRASRRVDQDACRDFERSLKAYSSDGVFSGGEWEGRLIEEYGLTRLSYILAATVLSGSEKAYPKEVRDWASTVRLSEQSDVNEDNVLQASPSLVAQFVLRNVPMEEKVADNENRADEGGERISVPASSYVRRYETYTAFSMPDIEGYDGYVYYMPNTAIRDDGEYRSFTLAPETEVNVQKGSSRRKMTFERLSSVLSNAAPSDYARPETVDFEFSSRSVMQRRGDAYRISVGRGRSVYVDAGWLRDEGQYFAAKIPFARTFAVYGRGDKEAPISAQELKDALGVTSGDEFSSDSHSAFEIPASALLTARRDGAYFKVPEGAPHEGYSYYIENSRLIKDPDLGTYTATMRSSEVIRLSKENGETVEMKVADLVKEISTPTKRANAVEFDIPARALAETKDMSYGFSTGDDAVYIGKTYVAETDKGYRATLPEDFSAPTAQGKSMSALDMKEAFESLDIKTPSRPKGEGERTVAVPHAALVAENEKRIYLRMPDGKLGRGSYWYPKSLVEKRDDAYVLTVPADMEVHIAGLTEGSVDISAGTFYNALSGKAESDYRGEFVRPTESLQGCMTAEREKNLRDHVPDEMKSRPNWVIARCPYNYEKGKREKWLVNCNNGHMAKSNDPSTWTDFESAMRYAKSHGGDTLAYALDGKDDIVCIDADHSVDIDGNESDKVKALRKVVPEGIYCERSVTGDGYHFFGKSPIKDVTPYSQDGELEMYTTNHFISMTGECEEGATSLASLDSEEARFFIRNNFSKRVAFKDAGKRGPTGLSSLSDQAVVQKAKESAGGDMFTRLYNGDDVKRDPSRSDYALMSRLAFWCDGDKDQMIRIFCSSGLYRPEKSDEYYEHTAMKAVENCSTFYNPKKNKGRGRDDGNKKS